VSAGSSTGRYLNCPSDELSFISLATAAAIGPKGCEDAGDDEDEGDDEGDDAEDTATGSLLRRTGELDDDARYPDAEELVASAKSLASARLKTTPAM
jgi:hypothetical protein